MASSDGPCVRATTRVAAVVGDPIEHSLSPVIHNAAFAAAGLDWVFVALRVVAGRGADAVRSMRTLGIDGLSVTMPLKSEVIAGLDELEPDAQALGAVNCVRWRGDRLVGANTDGPGFVAGLAADFDFHPEGRDCVVLGAGGAARAVVLALARAGARSVQVVNRTRSAAEAAAALAGPVGSVVDVDAVKAADLVVNATPLGMAGVGASADRPVLPCDPDLLSSGQVVSDLVYHPLRTPFVDAAAARGARASNGVSMLVHQAALAFESWTGATAPLTAVRAAVDAALGSTDGEPWSKR